MDWLVFLSFCQVVAVVSNVFVIVDYLGSLSTGEESYRRNNESLVLSLLIFGFVLFLMSIITRKYCLYLEVTVLAHFLSLLLNHYRYSLMPSNDDVIKIMRLGNCLFIIGTCITTLGVK